MLFDSLRFLLFFPIALLIYFLIPEKLRKYWLLASGYILYISYSIKYGAVLLLITLITYFAGLLINKTADKNKGRLMVASAFILCLAIMIPLKYFGFLYNISGRLGISIPIEEIILPVGLSFYTLSGLSYVVDVYRKEYEPSKNFFEYALFMSYFPALVAGPVLKYKDIMPAILKEKKFDEKRCFDGLLRMLWGFFLKLVIANRIAVFAGNIYGDPRQFYGYYLVVATILIMFEFYTEIAGYVSIAQGASIMLGIELTDSFEFPFLAESVKDFWKSFNISVVSWFREYIYIPLGGNKKGKLRKYINILITYILGAMWYGMSFGIIAFGLINAFFHIMGDLLSKIKERLLKCFELNRTSFCSRLVCIAVTFALVDFSLVFFKANGISDALFIIKSMINPQNGWVIFDGSMYKAGLSRPEFWMMISGVGILGVSDIFAKNGISIREKIENQDKWFKCLFVILAITALLTFGVWGHQAGMLSRIYY